MSCAINQSCAANFAPRQAHANNYDPWSRVGPSNQESFGYPPAYLSTNASPLQYEILTLFSKTFNPDIIPSDERPLVAIHWMNSLKRHLAVLHEVPSSLMLIYIYTLLEGSAHVATFALSQGGNVTIEDFFAWFQSRYCDGPFEVSVLNELQRTKQTGSLQEYIARHARLQAHNEFLPAPATAMILKESFVAGLQNPTLQKRLRSIEFTPGEIESGAVVTEVMKKAQRLVRDGVCAEYGSFSLDYEAVGQNSRQGPRGRAFGPPGSVPIRRPFVRQRNGPAFYPPGQQLDRRPFGMNGSFGNPGNQPRFQNGVQGQQLYLPPHRRGFQSGYQQDVPGQQQNSRQLKNTPRLAQLKL